MSTMIAYQRVNRQVGDPNFIVVLAWTTLGLALTAAAFALGYGVEIGQILAAAG